MPASNATSSQAIGFGTGGLLRIAGRRHRQEVLAAALDSGITHFDTAPIYGFGESERELGRFLRGRRGGITLATKFGLRPTGLASRLAIVQGLARQIVRTFPAARRAAVRNKAVLTAPPRFALEEIKASLDCSLRALRTDYLDFYLAHQASIDAHPDDDLIEFLLRARASGKIRAFGVATEFASLLPLLRRRPELSEVLQFDSEAGSQRSDTLTRPAGRLVIIYTLLGRSLSLVRDRLQCAMATEPGGEWAELAHLDDQTVGGLLLRGAALNNPGGIVLMQSRSATRIAANVSAMRNSRLDIDAGRLATLLSRLR